MALKILFALCVLLTTCISIQAALTSVFSWEQVPGTCSPEGSSCVGCRKIKLCLSSGFAIEATCESQNKLKPYCNKNTNLCDSEASSCPSEEESVEEASVNCKEEGIFPDLHNCRRYIMCVKTNEGTKKAFSFGCGGDKTTAFNYVTKTCQQQHPCNDFSATSLCTATNAGKIISYPPNRSIYGVCPKQSSEKAIIGNCKENEEFDQLEGGCKLSCSQSGRFADKNPDNFYECTLVGTKFVMDRYKCPLSLKFDNKKGHCA